MDVRVFAVVAFALLAALAVSSCAAGARSKPPASRKPPAGRTVTMKGKPLALAGAALEAGDRMPDVTLTGNDLAPVALASLKGRVLVLSSVPSLDTPVCAIETRRFNQEAAALGDGVRIVTVSMDLPFAQKRWCGAEGIDRVLTLSDHRDAAFGRAFGVLLADLRLLARCVWVVDREGVVRYVQLVPEIASEPDYAAVLAAAKKLL